MQRLVEIPPATSRRLAITAAIAVSVHAAALAALHFMPPHTVNPKTEPTPVTIVIVSAPAESSAPAATNEELSSNAAQDAAAAPPFAFTAVIPNLSILASPLAPSDAFEARRAVAATSPDMARLLVLLANCIGHDGRRRPECFTESDLLPAARSLAAWTGRDVASVLGSAYAGMNWADVTALLGGGPLMPNAPDVPLSSESDHRLSSIDSVRERVPVSYPDPAFGD